jgi:hypothetical protein
VISLKLSIDNFVAALLLGARERMTTQFAAERVTNLRDNLDLRRVIIFRLLKLLHGMLMIDRVGRKMDQVTGIVAEQTRAEKTAAFCIRGKFAKPEIVASQMQLRHDSSLRQ